MCVCVCVYKRGEVNEIMSPGKCGCVAVSCVVSGEGVE